MSRLRMVMDQGDPGLLDVVRRLGSQAIRSFVPGGGLALGAAQLLRPGVPTTGGIRLPAIPGAGLPAVFQLPAIGRAAAGGAAAGALVRRGLGLALAPGGRKIPAGSFRRAGLVGIPGRRRRRMNPTNFRALQRGLRRLKAFAKLAKMVIKSEARFKAPRKRGFGQKRRARLSA